MRSHITAAPDTVRVSRGCTDTGEKRIHVPTYYSTVNKRGRLSATHNGACALTLASATSHPVFLLPIPGETVARNLYSGTAMSQFRTNADLLQASH